MNAAKSPCQRCGKVLVKRTFKRLYGIIAGLKKKSGFRSITLDTYRKGGTIDRMKTTPKTPLETTLLKALKDSGTTIYEISKQSGLDTAPLYNFVNGKRSLTLPTAGRLADALGLELVQKTGKKWNQKSLRQH